MAEGATLAHVARPLLLAGALDPACFEVTVARPHSFAWLVPASLPFRVLDLACQPGEVFARRLERGAPLYDLATLERYVADDLALLDTERPDVVIGDFRLSLGVSARLRGVPYITVCDAYWSPERPLRAPLPVLPFTRFTPIALASAAFRAISPLALRLHALPVERLRKRHGLPSLGFDLRRCYTDADLRLFANFPGLFPELKPSAQADFIGPIAWSPASDVDLGEIPPGRGLIYVTMGSSGDTGVLAALIPVLLRTGMIVAMASAGRPLPPLPANSSLRVFDYLPGERLCRLARLVVCNGGSPTTNQALKHGVPVLGIARNMDQFLNMEAIEAYGAGLLVRADRADAGVLGKAVERLLEDGRFAARAGALAASLGTEAPESDLAPYIERLLGSRRSRPSHTGSGAPAPP